jgi:hypothetical protein
LIKKFIANSLLTLLGVVAGITFIFFVDGIYSALSKSTVTESESPFQQLDKGWYELKKGFTGYDKFGDHSFPVETTIQGFRKDVGSIEPSKYNFVFLGDSFTYGVNGPWDETFVGMFAERTTYRVLNGGVPSYSPTPFLHRYKEIVEMELLERSHKLVVAVDISDVQDEAGYWVDGIKHPEKRQAELDFRLAEQSNPVEYESNFRKIFPNVAKVFSYLKYDLLGSLFGRNSSNLDHPRSGFTYMDWNLLDKTFPYENPPGYKPFGVSVGLQKLKSKLNEINLLAKESGGEMYLLIYPWPSQLTHEDKFSFEEYITKTCQDIACSGVINTFPKFQRIKQDDPDWVKNIYHVWDIHLSKLGNRVIANDLLKFFPNQ